MLNDEDEPRRAARQGRGIDTTGTPRCSRSAQSFCWTWSPFGNWLPHALDYLRPHLLYQRGLSVGAAVQQREHFFIAVASAAEDTG
jgi:hypothetical protein